MELAGVTVTAVDIAAGELAAEVAKVGEAEEEELLDVLTVVALLLDGVIAGW